jgi:hypothetical protein
VVHQPALLDVAAPSAGDRLAQLGFEDESPDRLNPGVAVVRHEQPGDAVGDRLVRFQR